MSRDLSAIVAVLCAVAAAGCSNDDSEGHEAASQAGKPPLEAEVQGAQPQKALLAQQCITLKRNVNGSVEDTQIGSAVIQKNPGKNFGSSQFMEVGAAGSGAYETLLRWDMSAVPSNIGITSATMTLSVVSSGNMDLKVHAVNAEPTPWTEGAVTWTNFYANPAPQYGAAVQTVPITTATSSVSFDLKSPVTAWLGGAPNNGIILRSDDQLHHTVFNTSENQNVALRPALEICYLPNLCANVVCPAPDQCHEAGVCDPSTGVCNNPAKGNGSPCSDGDACTTSDVCQSGVCVAGAPVVCGSSDQCHDPGTCDPSTGVCSNPTKGDGTACNDGNACTLNDTCQSGACAAGPPVTCVADQCHTGGSCDPMTGLCDLTPKADGTACNDGNACTLVDTCQGGVCGASACPSGFTTTANGCQKVYDIDLSLLDNQPNNCGGTSEYSDCSSNPYGFHWTDVGTAALGAVVAVEVEMQTGISCRTGATVTPTLNGQNTGNLTETGSCSCYSWSSTAALDSIPLGAYVKGGNNVISIPSTTCSGLADDGPFDGNYARVTVTYGGGVVQCAPQDACHVAGVCDPGTGACSNPPAADGTACNDGDACTQTDACQSGACAGTNPVTCGAASDQCHAPGTCNPATGVCDNPPKADGTACNDNNACTSGETCAAGVCGVCPAGFTTTANSCQKVYDIDLSLLDNQPNTCGGTSRYSDCSSNPYGFHWADAATAAVGAVVAVNVKMQAGISCRTGTTVTPKLNGQDTGTFTENGTCSCYSATSTAALGSIPLGAYVKGGNNVISIPSTACSGLANDGPFNGNYARVTVDYAIAGSVVQCPALDACHVGVCDPASGACGNAAAADGTKCDDGDAATSNDVCTGGVCAGAPVGSVSVFTYTDTQADDIAPTALANFFSGLSVSSSDFIDFSISGSSYYDGEWCAEHADFYVNSYLSFAAGGSYVQSGNWNKYSRPEAGAWSGPDTSSYDNYFGTSCDGYPYSWCSEWGIGGRSLATMPGQQTGYGESYASGWSNGGNWVVTIKVGHTRLGTCGF